MAVKAYRYKLNPTKAQLEALGQWVGACRFGYNLCLEYKQKICRDYDKNPSKYDGQKELAGIANQTRWLKTLHSQTLQGVTDRPWTAYDKFFTDHKAGKHDQLRTAYLARCQRRNCQPNVAKLNQIGKVRFARRGLYCSFAFKQGVSLHENTNTVQLPKLGRMKYRNSQLLPPDAIIKRAVVSKQVDGWYVSLMVETTIAPLPIASNERVGVDVGIKDLAILSTGQVIANPKWLHQASARLVLLQQAVSRKKKGSANRNKSIKRLAEQHLRVRNTRADYLHKRTTTLLRENQAVVTEQLAIRNMVKNHKLAKAIMDASWGELNRQLSYKAQWYGRSHEQVNPAYTSQDCSTTGCDYRNTELPLAVRNWTCPVWLVSHERDVNAAVNINNKGMINNWLTCSIIPVAGRAQESPCP